MGIVALCRILMIILTVRQMAAALEYESVENKGERL